MQICVLPLDQLAEALASAPEVSRSLVIAAAHDGETLAMVRADGVQVTVPLSAFRPSGTTSPDFGRLELDDHGQTIRFGEYEAAVDFALESHSSG